LLDGLEGLVRQIGPRHLVGLLAGIQLHPGDAALTAVGLLDRRVEYPHRGPPDVGARAVSFDKADDGAIRHLEGAAGAYGDLVAFGNLDVLVTAHAISLPPRVFGAGSWARRSQSGRRPDTSALTRHEGAHLPIDSRWAAQRGALKRERPPGSPRSPR